MCCFRKLNNGVVVDSLLDEALLVLALGVDRRLGLVGLLAAREEESSSGEGGCEGSDRELQAC